MKAYSGKKKSRAAWVFPFLAVCLWLVSLVSAIAVVYSTWQSRKAIQALEELRREENGLQVISGQLLLEKSSWAAYTRVEEIAQTELGMSIAEPDKTVLVFK